MSGRPDSSTTPPIPGSPRAASEGGSDGGRCQRPSLSVTAHSCRSSPDSLREGMHIRTSVTHRDPFLRRAVCEPRALTTCFYTNPPLAPLCRENWEINAGGRGGGRDGHGPARPPPPDRWARPTCHFPRSAPRFRPAGTLSNPECGLRLRRVRAAGDAPASTLSVSGGGLPPPQPECGKGVLDV
jgi:hypothetical protein